MYLSFFYVIEIIQIVTSWKSLEMLKWRDLVANANAWLCVYLFLKQL